MKTAYRNCRLFTGAETSDSFAEGKTIVVEDERIAAVVDASETPVADTDVDLDGAYVLPGLINAHAHHFGTGKPAKNLAGGFSQKAILGFAATHLGKAYLDKLCEENLATALLSGVTTVRGVGDFRYADVDARDKIERGEMVGPHFIVSGPAMTVVDGHGAGTFAEIADTPEEFAALVEDRKTHGVDFIKICTTGGVMDSDKRGEAGLPRMSVEQTRAVCDRAHELGMKVASHTESTEGVEVDLEGGVDTIEHGSGFDERLAGLFKKSHAADICTIAVAYNLAMLPAKRTKLNPVSTYNANMVFERIAEGARIALAHDIPVGIGTDAACPFITHYDLWRDIYWFSRFIEVSPARALHIATLGNARILGIDDRTGSIESGKYADFIILHENPLEDLRALRHVDEVVIRGKRIADASERLEKHRLPEVDKALDSIMG